MGPMGMPMGGMGGMPMGGPGRRPPMGRPPMGGPGGRPERPGRPGEPPMGRPGDMPPHSKRPDNFIEKEFDLKQMEKESEEMVKMVSLNRHTATFFKTSRGLSLKLNDATYENVQLVETFPFTDPYVFISVRDPHNKHKEIGLIEDLEKDFDEAMVTLIKEQLDLYYHMPIIEKILNVKESGGYSNFTVMTNFGETHFSLRSNNSCITALNEKRLIIQDLEGNRFEVPDKQRLSPKDLKQLDLFM